MGRTVDGSVVCTDDGSESARRAPNGPPNSSKVERGKAYFELLNSLTKYTLRLDKHIQNMATAKTRAFTPAHAPDPLRAVLGDWPAYRYERATEPRWQCA